MLDFILEIVLFLSLGTVIYIVGRAVPRLSEEEAGPKRLRQFFAALPIHKFDAALASVLEKNLRKTRVMLLRVDNGVSVFLEKIKSGSGIHTVHPRKKLFFSSHAESLAEEAAKVVKEDELGPGTEV